MWVPNPVFQSREKQEGKRKGLGSSTSQVLPCPVWSRLSVSWSLPTSGCVGGPTSGSTLTPQHGLETNLLLVPGTRTPGGLGYSVTNQKEAAYCSLLVPS